MKKYFLAAMLVAVAATTPAQAMSLKAMKEVGSAIKWRDSDRDARMRDIDNYIMNVAVPSGDIDFGGIEGCVQGKLAGYKDVQPLDKKGPSLSDVMKECVY